MQLGLSAAEGRVSLFMEDLILLWSSPGFLTRQHEDFKKARVEASRLLRAWAPDGASQERQSPLQGDADPGQPDLSVLIIIANCHMI